MEIVQKISAPILEFGNKFEAYLIPALILLPILLILFSRFSYSIFKIVFPIAGALAGYFAGEKFLTQVVEKFFQGYEFIKPEHVAGAACALVLFILCLAGRKTAILAIGACVGYLVVGKIAIDALCKIGFMQEVLNNTPEDKKTIFLFMISAICACVVMYLFHKLFKVIYIYGTSIVSAVAAFAVPAIFVFNKLGNLEMATLVAAGIGALLGLLFGRIQHSRFRYFY